MELFDSLSGGSWWAALAVAAALVAFVQTIRIEGARWWRRASSRATTRNAAAGERRAAKILSRAGYEIVGAQVSASYDVLVDASPVRVDLRADYVVERGGRAFVAEVKTGRVAPRVDCSATRRQLLEYRVAFDVDGVLLVDAEADQIHEVVFPRSAAPRARGRATWTWLMAGMLLGVAGLWVALHVR